jgi:hypothetical protein
MGTLVFQATLGGAVNIIGPNIASTINFTLPSADGTSGQTWTTNGSGVLSFGTLGIAGGGTGQITATAAFNALAPSQSGQSGKYLTTDGTNTSWGTNPLGTVTSVAATVPSFLSIAGSPITTSGTLAFSLSGTALPTTSGGTGLTSFTSGGVVYASSSSALATGSALTFDGNTFGVAASGLTQFKISDTGSATDEKNWLLQYGTGVGAGLLRLRTGNDAGTSGQNAYIVARTGINVDSHQWLASGSEGMRLTSTGLGIGTSSPTRKLEVAAGTSGPALRLTNTNSNSGIEILTAATQYSWLLGAQYNISGAFEITPSTAVGGTTFTTPTAVFTQTGNVGIGTSSPAYKLDVLGNVNRFASASCDGIFLSSNPSTDTLYYGANYYNNAGTEGVNASGRASWRIATLLSGSPTFSIGYRAPSAGAGTFTQAMTLDASGNLGVGNTIQSNVNYQFGQSLTDSFGTIPNCTIGRRLGVSASPYSPVLSLGHYSSSYGMDLWVDTAGLSPGYIDIRQNESLIFRKNTTSGTATETMRIDSSGNLLLGGTLSNARLTVGTSDATAVIASGGSNTFLTLGAMGADGAIIFKAGGVANGNIGTERARIDSIGNLLVGTSTAYDGSYRGIQVTSPADVGIFKTSAVSGNMVFWNTATSGDNNFTAFYTETSITLRGSISYNRAGGLIAYNVTSDYRAKDIIGPVTNSGALIDSVPVYMGKMKDATQERPMFLAHETPNYAHTGEKDAVDKDGKPVYQQMDASALIPVMWAEIQSLRKRLADAGI